ncbi:hypothetical protein EIP91_010917 [Steccherinum ochraceum]|uniref:Uncharacterized protein n=1 Tax=Steccherinum ochraceum TaxID=92696 RepID=A0A4R0R7X7_9APHY|nr:hypothetical protein EIP91_010917 [Steccherinum ochraceum]
MATAAVAVPIPPRHSPRCANPITRITRHPQPAPPPRSLLSTTVMKTQTSIVSTPLSTHSSIGCLHRLRSAYDTSACVCHLCSILPPPTTQGLFFGRASILRGFAQRDPAEFGVEGNVLERTGGGGARGRWNRRSRVGEAKQRKNETPET